MRNQLLGASLMMALIAFPVATFAQSGAATGAAAGAAAGGAAGGPAGAAVGAGVGAVAGGLTDANRPKFRQYVTTQKRPSFAYEGRRRREAADQRSYLNPTRMHIVTHLSPKYQGLRNSKNNWSIQEAGMAQLDDDVGIVMQKRLQPDGHDYREGPVEPQRDLLFH